MQKPDGIESLVERSVCRSQIVQHFDAALPVMTGPPAGKQVCSRALRRLGRVRRRFSDRTLDDLFYER